MKKIVIYLYLFIMSIGALIAQQIGRPYQEGNVEVVIDSSFNPVQAVMDFHMKLYNKYKYVTVIRTGNRDVKPTIYQLPKKTNPIYFRLPEVIGSYIIGIGNKRGTRFYYVFRVSVYYEYPQQKLWRVSLPSYAGEFTIDPKKYNSWKGLQRTNRVRYDEDNYDDEFNL